MSLVAPFSATDRNKILSYTTKIFLIFVVGASLFYMFPVYAQTATTSPAGGPAAPAIPGTPNLSGLSPQTMLLTIASQFPALMRMITAIAYLLGIIFIYHGLMKLKQFGESRTQMSTQHTMTEPMLYLGVGTMLLYLPTAVNIGLSTFWTNASPYSYTQNQDQWSQMINICFQAVQLVGVVAFIRGLIILSHLGGQGGQQNHLSKGLMHIIGGIFCINIYQFVQMVMATIGA